MKTKLLFAALPAAAILLTSTGVAAQQQAVDCSTAKADIAHLEHEKKSTDERKIKGVMSIMPIGLAINAVSSAADSSSPKEMKIDDYNKALEARIAAIRSACNM